MQATDIDSGWGKVYKILYKSICYIKEWKQTIIP